MDEPFGALDALTREEHTRFHLQNLVGYWQNNKHSEQIFCLVIEISVLFYLKYIDFYKQERYTLNHIIHIALV